MQLDDKSFATEDYNDFRLSPDVEEPALNLV